MKIKQLPAEFIEALPVMQRLEEHGYEAYFVGGSVRDIMMQRPIHDVDIATSAYPEEVQSIFPSTIDLGIEHGTVLVLWDNAQYEVTTFRTESDYQDYRRPDHVTFVRSLAEDLKRRDFRMNALAMNARGEVIDLFNGIEDIKEHRICAVGVPYERFHEDALRMMRAVRFASQLGFHIEEETYEAIVQNHQLLKKISVERIQVEWLKLMAGAYPQKGLRPFIDSCCYQSCPYMADQKEALEHLCAKLQSGVNEKQAWLLYGYCAHYSSQELSQVLRAWKCSNQLRTEVCHTLDFLVRRLERPLQAWELYELGKEGVDLLTSVLFFFDEENTDEREKYAALPIHALRELAIDGKMLMQVGHRKAGPWLGQLLKVLQKAVVNQEVANTETALIKFSQDWMEANHERI